MKRDMEKHHSDTALMEAVETLTNITELDIETSFVDSEAKEIPALFKTVHWLHKKNAERVIHIVRETYKVILDYLMQFHKKESGRVVHEESIEGIKSIMVLVGEAAKKVDTYSQLFAARAVTSIRDTKEYKDLLSFYQGKIVPISISDSLSKWAETLPVQDILKKAHHINKESLIPKVTDHLFIDLESVKKDLDYELFLIRKHDGARFFNPQLLKNIKLISNFEEKEEIDELHDATRELKVWCDHQFQKMARDMLRRNWTVIDQFIKDCRTNYNHCLSMSLYRAIVALMLSANATQAFHPVAKGASAYFKDFQYFFREVTGSLDFKRLKTYPPKNEEHIGLKILHLTAQFAKDIFTGFHTAPEMTSLVDELIEKGKGEIEELVTDPDSLRLHTKLTVDFDAMGDACYHFHHAPMQYTLDSIEARELSGYDPFMMQNIPSLAFDLFVRSNRVGLLRLPCPVQQNYIHKAHITDEFKVYIDSLCEGGKKKHLLVFNLEDRTSWKDFARSHALEDMQKNEEFSKGLTVCSMTKDSDFYRQKGPYQDLTSAPDFIAQLLEHVQSENSGFWYPQHVKKALFAGFTDTLANTIHEIFFGRKNVLSKNARQNFIELFYLFIQLKIIEEVGPSSIAYSCKDGLDISQTACSELFLVLKLLNNRPLSSEEIGYLKLMLFGPTLLVRGRSVFVERFNRLQSVVALLESLSVQIGEKAFHTLVQTKLHTLFDKDILESVIEVPHPLL